MKPHPHYNKIIFFDTEFMIDKKNSQPFQVGFIEYDFQNKILTEIASLSFYIKLSEEMILNKFVIEKTNITAVKLQQVGLEIEVAKKDLLKYLQKQDPLTTLFVGWGIDNDIKVLQKFLSEINFRDFMYMDLANKVQSIFKLPLKTSLENATISLQLTKHHLHDALGDAYNVYEVFQYLSKEVGYRMLFT